MSRTKIVATVGPASDSPHMLEQMLHAGVSVFRIGLAHGSADDALSRIRAVRAAQAATGVAAGVLVDLPGPKVRAGSFGTDGVHLEADSTVRLVPGRDASTSATVFVDYDELLDDLQPGDRLTVGDGATALVVTDACDDHLVARVGFDATVRGRPGLHIPSDRLRIPTPTDEDLELLDVLVPAGVDMVALSFVRTAADLLRANLAPHPDGPLLVAKIETRAAVEHLDDVIQAAGAVMVARGDLGAEYPIEYLPELQKRIISRCVAFGRPVITATQMLESMVTNATPTRAEASDVANAVHDSTSAVMLSGETAVGADPLNVVATMRRIVARTDSQFDHARWVEDLHRDHLDEHAAKNPSTTDAMSSAVCRLALEVDAEALVVITRSGFSARAISRFRLPVPVVACTTSERVARQLALTWGVYPTLIEEIGSQDATFEAALRAAAATGRVRPGARVVVLGGSSGESAFTDVIRVAQLPV